MSYRDFDHFCDLIPHGEEDLTPVWDRFCDAVGGDEYTIGHYLRWLEPNIAEEDRRATTLSIVEALEAEPVRLERWSWWELSGRLT